MRNVLLGVGDAALINARGAWGWCRARAALLASVAAVLFFFFVAVEIPRAFPDGSPLLPKYDVSALIAIALVSAYVALVIVLDTNIWSVFGVGLLLLFTGLWAIYQRSTDALYRERFLESNVALWAIRLTLYLGLSMVAGGVTYRFLRWPKPLGRTIIRLIVLIVALAGAYALLLAVNGGRTP